ncbi:hypothetical protein [Jiella mangrovi]|uniref:Uncharacterized protein n=1 Tax=Jiella mangrovi TaxID=2821407 RepID=A0ABS4BBZ9_9HYPH|nr:hypothetical protein [Jiella mangrovi]MBP0614251.1 hypothetical protein [Jiella mangrovi]
MPCRGRQRRKGTAMTIHTAPQLGFDELLAEAAETNRKAAFERETGHLPGSMEAAVPYLFDLIAAHHAAMLAADIDEALRLRGDAHRLAEKLNDGGPGILAGPDAPGCRLERLTASQDGTVPLWGQTGSFIIETHGIRARIEMSGLFGIGAGFSTWPGFAAHAVDWNRPFISQTGYRTFLGIHAEPAPGLTPDTFAEKVIAAYVEKELKGKPVAILPDYRKA